MILQMALLMATVESPSFAAAARPPILVRRYHHPADCEAVRRIWPAGLLENTRVLAYPPSLVEEEEQFVRETMASGDMIDLQAAYQTDSRTDFWVAVDRGGADVDPPPVVGCVGLRLGKGEGEGDIGRFAVDSAHRGRGVARQLLKALEEHARQAGFSALTATTCAMNAPALATFKACGFDEVYRGRMDGKPEPEFVPFVRLRRGLQ